MANNTGTFFNINDNDGIPLVGVSTNGKVMINHLYGNCLIGSTSVTGTTSQPLQVTGGAYVSGNLGIGTTNPTVKLDIIGNAKVLGIITASTLNIGTGGTVFTTTSIGNIGIGTTTPTSKLQVERYGVSTGFGTFSATAGIATDIDTFAISSIDFKTVEYTLHFTNDSNIQAQKVLVMQNGTTSHSQEYGIMFEPNRIVSIGATFSSGVCKLQATPESGISGLVVYRIVRQGLL